MSGLYGVSAYQQTNSVWNQKTKKTEDTVKTQTTKSETAAKTEKDVQTSTWKPIDTSSSLVPSNKDGIGMAIGDVQLSDKAKDYYSK